MDEENQPGAVVVEIGAPVTPEPARSDPVADALDIARAIAKSDEILSELRALYSVVTSAIGKIDALESQLAALSAQVDGVAATTGAILAREIVEPEETAEIVAEVVEELQQEAIPAESTKAPEAAPPEEKRTRRRGFF